MYSSKLWFVNQSTASRSSSIAVTGKWIGNDKLSSLDWYVYSPDAVVIFTRYSEKESKGKGSVKFALTARSTTTGQQNFWSNSWNSGIQKALNDEEAQGSQKCDMVANIPSGKGNVFELCQVQLHSHSLETLCLQRQRCFWQEHRPQARALHKGQEVAWLPSVAEDTDVSQVLGHTVDWESTF